MRRNRWLVFVLIAFCTLSGIAAAQPPDAKNFVTHLSGDEEVPPVDTLAQGQTIFHLRGSELLYKLIVANIEGVTQAHIHCGAEGVNGPVVAFLFGLNSGGVDANGVLAQGTLTNSDVIPRPDSALCPGGVANFDQLIAKMRSGETYANVHTLVNTGGEIRGQISTAGPDNGG
jgi:hypothetical protein